ncbi:NAD(P)-binding protein [Exidia glandulosa HHB12029]|uniref:NAD(P)-binding protein n=1 Tax=Exidia glandulosa HHB12029 TaxID=1314781 RepID=A0A165EHK7_EXIGL|nr:NAD(P)-binding protein [Exidia glandulosa HHB12029]
MSPRVLLTGASGFIAAHVLDQLLKKGYWVRATVRSDRKKQEILSANAQYASQLDFAIVGDISQPGAFDEAVKAEPGLDYIVHTASPFHFHPEDIERDILKPAVQGTLGVLQAAKKFAPTVKRVVITSSDWNPITWEQALAEPVGAYYGSKTFAEKAAYEFLDNEKPSFDIVTLNPPMVYGPILNSQTAASLNESNTFIYNILTGKTDDGKVPKTGVHIWVDVRDIARAHILALETPAASNQRFLIKADGIYSAQEIADVLRKHFPEQPRIPVGTPGGGLGLKDSDIFLADNSKSKEVLGMQYGSLEEMLIPLAKDLLALKE